MNTVVAFTNSGGIRCDLLANEGETTRTVTVGDIYAITPFGNRLYTYDLTGAELAATVENSFKNSNYGDQFSGMVVKYTAEPDGKDENGNLVPYHLGHFFIAIDTDHFLGEEQTRKKAGEIIRSVRASKKAPGHDHIFSAGEKEYNVWLQRKDSGVPINESVQAEMNKVRDDLKLNYVFPWEK